MARLSLFPDDAAAVAEALGCPSISYTYSEPTAFYEYTCTTPARRRASASSRTSSSPAARSRTGRRATSTSSWTPRTWTSRASTRTSTASSTPASSQPILNTLKTLKELGVWFEIINLVVPTYTDNLDTIRRMCGWIAKELGPDQPLHFSRFHPAAQARAPHAHARRDAGEGARRRPQPRACTTSTSATCPASKAPRRPGAPTARRPSSSATSSPSPR